MPTKQHLLLAAFAGLAIAAGITNISHAECPRDYKYERWELHLVDVTIDGEPTTQWEGDPDTAVSLARPGPELFIVTVEEADSDEATEIRFFPERIPAELLN